MTHTPHTQPHTDSTPLVHPSHTHGTGETYDFLGPSTVANTGEYTDSTENGVQTNVQPHTPRTHPAHTEQFYSSVEIADRYPDLGKDGGPIGESAIRTRWYEWLKKVAPEQLLKSPKGFTQLASDLFDEFAQLVKREGMKPEDWVEDAKHRYAQEWSSSGVIDGELMPEQVGGALALAQSNLDNLALANRQEEEDLMAFIKQTRSARADLSQKDIELAQRRGKNRAIAKFRVELQAELQTEAQLRQALEGETGGTQ